MEEIGDVDDEENKVPSLTHCQYHRQGCQARVAASTMDEHIASNRLEHMELVLASQQREIAELRTRVQQLEEWKVEHEGSCLVSVEGR